MKYITVLNFATRVDLKHDRNFLFFQRLIINIDVELALKNDPTHIVPKRAGRQFCAAELFSSQMAARCDSHSKKYSNYIFNERIMPYCADK